MNLKYLLFSMLILLSITITQSNAYAETWKVQIPAGSYEPTSKVHFLPSEISVRPGDRVEWGNADSVTHTVTSGTLELGLTEMFDSGHMGPGSVFSVRFDEKNLGEMKYFCTIHPWMIGIVNVIDHAVGFEIIHNVGSKVSESPIDVAYKVQRNLVNAEVDPVRNSITFSFTGKIDNDKFTVRLPEKLIKDPQAVWIDDKQTTNYELTKMDGITTLTIILHGTAEEVKVVGTEVIGKSNPKKHVLINQIYGITDKKLYEQGDEIIISGEIKNPTQLYKLYLDIISPEGYTAYHSDIHLVDSTKFSEIVSTSGVLREFGKYTVKITGSDAKNLYLPFEYGIIPKEFNPPLKQMRIVERASDVICNEGLELLMKNSNGNAVCLTEPTAKILLQRGVVDYF